jgi:uncharacterized protein YbjT (DUF2867 family)
VNGVILVTGASGKTARHLLPLLTERGAAVRAAHRQAQATGVRFDWEDPGTWDAALAGVDRLYLVQPAGNPQPDRHVLPFAERAAAAGVRRTVLLSAMGVEQAPPETGMRRVELALPDLLPEVTILRPNWFMQNFSEGFQAQAIVEHGVIADPAGDGAVSFVDARDIAAVAAAALLEDGHAGAAYPLTGPEALTFPEVAERISKAADHEVRYEPADEATFRNVLLQAGLQPGYADALLGLYGAIRAGYAAAVTDTVEQVTGRPARSFGQYAEDAAERWRS